MEQVCPAKNWITINNKIVRIHSIDFIEINQESITIHFSSNKTISLQYDTNADAVDGFEKISKLLGF